MDTQSDPQKRLHRATGSRERKRAARACDACHRQKEKCEGGAPCRRCSRLGHKCEFSGRTSRRAAGHVSAAPVPGSVATPEATVRPTPSRTAEQDPGDLASRVIYLEKILQQYTGNINLDSETLRDLAENPSQQRPLPPSALPANASSSSEFVGVDDQSFCIKPLENNITHYSGEFSHWNFSMRIKQWIDQSVPPNDGRNEPPSPVMEYYRAEELQSPSNVATSVSFLPPRFVTNFLVHAFFTYAEANYWYVERGWLTRRLDAIYEDAASLTRRDVGAVCVIFMVLAVGTQYAYLESHVERLGGPVHKRPVADAGLFSEDTVGVMFYQQACRLVPDVITVSSLESVQACLLIGIYTLPLDASGLSYIYLNLAVKLAIQNGMHRTYPGEGLDASVWETRNRVWWTAYTIERRVGIFHGRPISISATDVDVRLPVDRADLWPLSTSTHTAHFLATLRLNQLLSSISHEISVLRTYTRQELSAGVDRLLELRRELASWWDSLPDDRFPCKALTPESPISRLSMHLKLEYCLTRVFVGRVFIFPRGEYPRHSRRSTSAADAEMPPGTAASPSKSHSRSILVADCIEASLEVVDTCKLLRDSVGLARASYTEFSACRAALLVITTQCLQHKTDRFRRALRDGLSMLKEMSAGGDSARSEMSLIEAFERAIAKIDAASAEGRADSDYARFKKWEQLWKSSSPSVELANDPSPDDSVPMGRPPLPAGSRRTPDDAPMARQGGGGVVSMPSNTPFFGMDGNFASFPQTLDEFPSFLGSYDFEPGQGSAHDNVGAGNSWIGNAW